MSLLDDLLLGFDEALEWPVDDDDAERVDPATGPASGAAGPG